MNDLTAAQRAFLEAFTKSDLAAEYYLSGGTARSAFYLHHRLSEDLDLFTRGPVDSAALRLVSSVAEGPVVPRRIADRFGFIVPIRGERVHDHHALSGWQLEDAARPRNLFQPLVMVRNRKQSASDVPIGDADLTKVHRQSAAVDRTEDARVASPDHAHRALRPSIRRGVHLDLVLPRHHGQQSSVFSRQARRSSAPSRSN